jgi:holliday junction DNA helicase RuvA
MIVFLVGKFVVKTPAMVWMDVNGIGYEVNISLNTYSQIQHAEQGKLLTYLQIKEDGHSLYGFIDEEERNTFLALISVSGVGASIARMMLSSMKPDEIRKAIVNNDERTLEKIKGIGAKSAKRLILELKEKMMKLKDDVILNGVSHNNLENDALNALMSLGIARMAAQNALQKVSKQQPNELSLEETIKFALKNL